MTGPPSSPWRRALVLPGPVTRGHIMVAAKAGIGAGIAWWVALSLVAPHGQPYFAPLAVVLVVQATIYDSLARAVQRVVGVLIGVAVALGVAQFIPLDGWAVAAVVFVGLLIGRVLRLGPSGMVQVPVSALLVLFVGSVSSGYPGRRIIDTVIGAAIGVAVVLVSPPAPRAEAIVSSATEPLRGAAGLLTAMGSGIAQPWTKHQAEGWHGQAVALVASIADARGSLESAKLAARWNARARSLPPQLERADDALSAGRRVCIHLRSMTLALTAVPEGEPPKPVLGEVTVLLAQVVLAYGEWMTHDEDEASRRRFESATWACEQRLGAFVELAEERWQSDAQRWLTLGVVLAGIQRILAVVTEPIDA